MKRTTAEFTAGLFVIVGILGILYLAVNIAGQNIIGNKMESYSARFTNVTGLKVGSDVRLAGVSIGEVTRIDLDPDTFYAMVKFKLPAGVVLEDDTIVSIRTNGLLGDKFLSISPGGSGLELEPGDLIVDTESAVNLEDILGKIAFGGVDE